MRKLYTYILTMFLFMGLASGLNAQRLITHDFNDGNYDPYEINKADQESRVNIVNNSVETHWQQELYNGTNSGRKAQIRPIEDIIFTQHIWMGLKLKIHDDYMKENTNTNAGLMQIWGKNDATGAANHMCMLKFDGRNGGALVWQHRYNSVADKTHYLVEPNFPRDEFVDVIVHVQLKTRNTGIVQVWINGELKVDKTNQTIGWGDMDETGMINETYCFGTSIGQYNFFADAGLDDAYDGEDHMFDGHMEGEKRTVSYDNVALYNGVDGYDLVDPSDDITTPVCLKSTAKTEAECYDAMSGIQTQESSEGTDNVGWIQNGDWTAYNSIDLTGMYSVNARVATQDDGGTIEVRLGSETGTLIGSLDVVNTSGSQVYETVSVNIEKTEGVKDVYLVYTGGDGYLFNINWFGFSEEFICSNSTALIEAECYDDMEGVQTEDCSEGTLNVGYINDEDWVKYTDIDLTNMNSIKARVSSKTTGNIIEVHLDAVDGDVIAQLEVSNTGGNQNWVTDSVNIDEVTGVHDVYLVFSGAEGYLYNINSLGFSEEELIVTSVNSEIESKLEIYPNPVTDVIHLSKNTTYSVVNSTGINVLSGKSNTVDVSNLPRGVYIIKLENQTQSIFKL